MVVGRFELSAAQISEWGGATPSAGFLARARIRRARGHAWWPMPPMPYTVTFYALHSGPHEVVVTVHRVEPSAIVAYTGAPAIALGAVRTVKGSARPDGFRVVDASGRVVLNYVDRACG